MKRLLTTIFVLTLCVMTSFAQSSTSWIGSTDSLWHNADNWTNGVPSNQKHALIGDSAFVGPYHPYIGEKANSKSVTIGVDGIPVSLNVGARVDIGWNSTKGVEIGPDGTINHLGDWFRIVGGDYYNDGVFHAQSDDAQIRFESADATVSGNGSNTFGWLVVTQNTTVDKYTSFTIANKIQLHGGSTFLHELGGSGKVILTSTAFSGGDIPAQYGNLIFGDMVIEGDILAGGSFEVAGNLTVNGVFEGKCCGGVQTLSGENKVIDGSGTVFFNNLDVTGSITTNKDIKVRLDMNVPGSFIATDGLFTFTFKDTLSVSGHAQFNDLKVDRSLALLDNTTIHVCGDITGGHKIDDTTYTNASIDPCPEATVNTEGDDRYWIANVDGDWNDPLNWSSTSGGVGNYSVPDSTKHVVLDANGSGEISLQTDATIKSFQINGYADTLQLYGHVLSMEFAESNLIFNSGSIHDCIGTGSVEIINSASTYFSGTTFGAELNVASARLFLNGSTFNDTSHFTKTGERDDTGGGGNTFNGITSIINEGTGDFNMGHNNPDVFNADVTFSCPGHEIHTANTAAGTQFNGNIIVESAGGNIEFGNNGGTSTLADGKTISVGPGGFSAGYLRLINFTQLGNTPQSIQIINDSSSVLNLTNTLWNGDLTATCPRVKLKTNEFNGALSLTKTGPYYDHNEGGNTFNGVTYLENSSDAHFWALADSSPDIFNGVVTFHSKGGRFEVARSAEGTEFNDNVYVESSGAGVNFGSNGGTCLLADGKTISIGSSGFDSGNMHIANFTQLGGTNQSLILTGIARVYFDEGSNWNGHLNTSTPAIYFNGTTFNSGCDFTKTGTRHDTSNGGNVFNGPTTITLAASGKILLGVINPDIFNDNASFINNSGSTIREIEIAKAAFGTEFYGDVNLESTIDNIWFNQDGGSVVFKGGADQTINIAGGMPSPEFRYLSMDKTNGVVNLNTPISVKDTLELVNGTIVSSASNQLTLLDDAVAIGSSNNSYVDGPVTKIGDDAFTFPVGDGGVYQPIAISAPADAADEFVAEYINANIDPSYDNTAKAASIQSLVTDNYWTLDRSAGTSDVEVSLSWNECNGYNSEDLVVANWNGSQWDNLGNGGSTGDKDAGNVGSNGVVSNFGSFALAFDQAVVPCSGPVNQAPYFTSAPIDSAAFGTGYTYAVNTSDPDGDLLSLSITGLPNWMENLTIAPGKAQLMGMPDCADKGQYDIELTVSDGELEVTQSFTLIVFGADTLAPTISNMPANMVLNTDSANNYAIVTWTEPSASDNCSLESLYADQDKGGQFEIGITTVKYIARDEAGNEAMVSFTITVEDNEAPEIICASDMNASTDAGKNYATLDLISPEFSDNDGIADISNDSPATFPMGSTLVTWTATDYSGNQSTCTQEVVVEDNEAPSINCAANISVSTDTGENFATLSLSAPEAMDNDGIAEVSNDSPATFQMGTTLVTWTATDNSGNESTCTQEVVVEDNETPQINCASDINASTDAGKNYATLNLTAPEAMDNDGIADISNDSPATFPMGTTLVIWTATDNSGNKSTCTQEIVVEDIEAPKINCASDMNVSTDAGKDYATLDLISPEFSDNDGIADISNDSPATFPMGTTLVTWTATDNSGNESTCTQEIVVEDNEAPKINCASDMNVSTDAGKDYATLDLIAPEFSDNDGIAEVSNDSPATFPMGTTLVTWTATDNSGNKSTCTQEIVVEDNEAPSVNCASDINASTDAGENFATLSLSAPEAMDNDGIASLTSNAPATFTMGSTMVTWTVTDNSGNESTCTQEVVVEDNEAPSITCASDMNVSTDTGKDYATLDLIAPEFSDNDAIADVSNDSPATFPLGSTLVTWTATDNSGNESTCTQEIVVEDNEAPSINCAADISTSTDAGENYASLSLSAPEVIDNDGIASLTNDAPATFPIGSTLVTWTATDNSGIEITCTQEVVVEDNEAPQINCTADISVSTDAGKDYATLSLSVPEAIDNDGIANLSNDAPATFQIGSTLVTWTATDNSGNESTCTQEVVVEDNEAPQITCASDINTSTDAGENYATIELTAPEAMDNDGIANLSNNAPASFPMGSTLVAWTAIDNGGNKSACTQEVIVEDNEAPQINCASDISVSTDAGESYATLSLTAPEVSDNNGIASLSNNAPATFPMGSTLVTWTATDNSGNDSTCIQEVVVEDNEAPQINCAADISASTDAGENYATLSLTAPEAMDNDGIASLTSNVLATFPMGSTLVTWTATDNSGNESTCTLEVVVEDNEAPSINCASDMSVSTHAGENFATLILSAPEATDNDGIASLTNDAPATFPMGSTLVTWTATDNSGNETTCTQEVVVEDNEAPSINCASDMSVSTDAGENYASLSLTAPEAMDNDGIASLTNDAPAAFPMGTTLVTWTAMDNSGNESTCTQEVVVDDNEAPSISCASDISASTDAGENYAMIELTAPDAMDNDGIASLTNDAPATFPLGSTLVTWTATDNSGNESTCTQMVTVFGELSFLVGADQEIYEDAGEQIIEQWATSINSGSNNGSNTLSFIVENDNNALFTNQPSVDSHGTLTYESLADAFGSATVSISLTNGLETTAIQYFQITVNPVNDAPSFTAGSDLEIEEEEEVQRMTWATNISAGANEHQELTFEVSNDNTELFEQQPAIDEYGRLTFESAEDAHGIAIVTVVLKDDGGIENGGVDSSDEVTFKITVVEEEDDDDDEDDEDREVITSEEDDKPLVYVPNIFSRRARHDANRSIKVYSNRVDETREMMFEIYDLSGNLVYQARDWRDANQNGWDGSNIRLNSGKKYFAYQVQVFLEDGSVYRNSGTIVMIQ